MSIEIRVPDIGDFKNIPVIEINVQPGDLVVAEQTLIMLESDKATLDVPTPVGGRIIELVLKLGDKVSAGSLVALLEPAATSSASIAVPAPRPVQASAPLPAPAQANDGIVVIGAGPGGYAAAFRAGDLGAKVTLIERRKTLGGVCLNVGCIPSKALLHAAKLISEAQNFAKHGISFGPAEIDLDALRDWKNSIIARLTGGLTELAKRRKVDVIYGEARFTGPHEVTVTAAEGIRQLGFSQAIIAAGSEPVMLPFLPENDPRIIDSTGALAIENIPARLLIIGGGVIGLEMATVYAALGSRITVVELADQLIPGADKDLVAPLQKHLEKSVEAILLGTKIIAVTPMENGLLAKFETATGSDEQLFDKILVATGRRPNGAVLAAQAAGVQVEPNGFILVDRQMRTNVAHIFAIGDVVGQPMLAHKATHEGHVAAEVACGHHAAFDARVIPSVAYTDPEIAWVGLTETQAKASGTPYEKAVFPWAASGRSLSLGRDEGLTKLLFAPDTNRLLGAGIVGPHAGDLIAEAALAIEMGSDAKDLALTIHPHPTLSETIGLAAEMFEGTITDLLPPRPRPKHS